MVCKASGLKGMEVQALDGAVGKIEDIYFDDERWGVRHLVVRTGGWFNARRVLLSPLFVRRPLAAADALQVELTRDKVRNGPSIDEDKPVSRHYEAAHADYYGYPYYWGGPMLWGGVAYPGTLPVHPGTLQSSVPTTEMDEARQAELNEAQQTHLRSWDEVRGYRVEARDGDAGVVDDLLIDPDTWAVRELVVDTRNWWPGGEVAFAPQNVAGIDWAQRHVQVDMTRDAIKSAPRAP